MKHSDIHPYNFIYNYNTVTLPVLSFQDIEDLLNKSRILDNSTAISNSAGIDGTPVPKYTVFSILDQKRANIMLDIARIAQRPQQREFRSPQGGCSKSCLVTLRSVQYVLTHTWNPTDIFCRELINGQIEMHFHLAGSLVDWLSILVIDGNMEEEYSRECDEAFSSFNDSNQSDTGVTIEDNIGLVPDPRALGLISKYATEDMKILKRLILLSISKALHLAALINDEIGIQNAVIHFWNLHLHIFRNKSSSIAIPEVLEFLKASSQIIQSLNIQSSTVRSGGAINVAEKVKSAPKGGRSSPRNIVNSVPLMNGVMTVSTIDEKLAFSIVEALVEFQERRGDYQDAITTAMNAITTDSNNSKGDSMIIIAPFLRRRLCESASRCAGRLALKPGATAAVSVAAAVNSLKFDNVILVIYGALSLAEMPTLMTNNDTVLAAVEKATRLMEVDVAGLLLSVDWPSLSQDDYDQVMEMQVEIFSRIVRLNIVMGDIRSAQLIAEKCLSLVAPNMDRGLQREVTSLDIITPQSGPQSMSASQKLSPRVWRWVSVCEKLFGIAICGVIQDQGQDESLKRELRLASLRHFALACTYGVRAQRVELVIEAATTGWNVIRVALESQSMDGMAEGGETYKNSILTLQFQILESLLGCKENVETSGDTSSGLFVLLQQMYVSMVTQLLDSEEWTKASKLVMEAFQHVPAALQKSLWKLRVIIMSKQGKNVLDGIQKMIAGDGKRDLALQARVYSILARASSTGRQQLDAYRKTIELLEGDPGRVGYILETAQWMSSYGLSRSVLSDMLLSALDALYEIEESNLIPPEEEFKDHSYLTCRSTARSKIAPSLSSARGAVITSRKGSISGRTIKTSRSGSQTRRKSFSSSLDTDQLQGISLGLDAKQCEEAVRTSLMLALLQSDESSRLERLLEGIYFVGRSVDQWTSSLKAADKGVQWAMLSIEEKEAYPIYANFNPTSPGQTSTLLMIPTDAVSLLSWNPSSLFLELNTLYTIQHPLYVPSAVSFPLMPLTIHYLLWGANELHSLGHQKHGILLLGWLRAILFVIPLQKKEFVLAAAHYKALTILYSCGVRTCDVERILPPVLGATSTSPAVFLSDIGENTMSALSTLSVTRLECQLNGINTMEEQEQQNIFRVSTVTKVMGTTDSLATDIPSCLLNICDSLKDLGQYSLAQHLIGVARAHAVLRGDKHTVVTTISIQAEYELAQGRARESLSLLLLSKDLISEISDGILLSKVARIAATCYAKLGIIDESRRVVIEALELLDISSLRLPANSMVTSALLDGQKDNNSTFNHNPSMCSTSKVSMGATATASFSSTFQKVGSLTTSPSGSHNAEGSLECVTALVETFCTYLSFISDDCSSIVTAGIVNFDFIASLAVIDNTLEIVLQKVTAVAGVTSLLAARVLESAAEASYASLTNMQKVNNSYNNTSATDYPIWFQSVLQRIIQSTTAAVDIRRDLCSQLSEKELTFEFNSNTFKIPDMTGSPKKNEKKNISKNSGKKSLVSSQDVLHLEVDENMISSLLSTLQRDLSKVGYLLICFLAMM